MTKKEIEEQLERAQETLYNLQKQLDELKQVKIEEPLKKRWKPEQDYIYWFVGSDGDIYRCSWHNDEVDNFRYLHNNVFKTKTEAEEYRKKINIQAQFKNFVEERSEKLNWKNDDQCKYSLYYDYYLKEIKIGFLWVCKYQNVIYASSEQILKDAIKEIGEDNVKKYILEVE